MSPLKSYFRPREGVLGYSGIDALNDASRISGVEFTQTGRGTLQAQYRLTSLSRVHFSTAVYSQGVVCRGAPSPGSCIMTIPTAHDAVRDAVGTIGGEECTFQREGREFVNALPERHRILAVVLDLRALQEAAEAHWGLPLERITRGGIFHTRGRPSRATLREHVEQLGAVAASAAVDGPGGGTLAREIEQELFGALVGAAVPDGTVREQPDRQRLARKAASLLRENVDAPDFLAGVASHLRTTLRTLELGFQEVYGLSPWEFRHLLRLQRAREELRRAVPEETVGQIAMRNGLVHLGRFSVSYRKVFGESPSETIRAARRQAA
jgi:AraC-like DNA-binding protein